MSRRNIPGAIKEWQNNRNNPPKHENCVFLKTREEITQWFKNIDIPSDNYSLVQDEKYGFVVNMHMPILFYKFYLNFIPVKFNIVEGDFNCAFNNLTSLEFAPREVRGDFNCGFNYLKSLEHSPQRIEGNFNCSSNQIETLEHCPSLILGSFSIINNKIKNLDGFSSHIKDSIELDIDLMPSIDLKRFNCQTLYLTGHSLKEVQNISHFQGEKVYLSSQSLNTEIFEQLRQQFILSPQFPEKLNTQLEIKSWLDIHGVINYSFIEENEEIKVNVAGNVDLKNKKITHIPFQFNKIQGDFDISKNFLTTLKGSPVETIGIFSCSENLLLNLEHGPCKTDNYFASRNYIDSVEYLPNEVANHFNLGLSRLSKEYHGLNLTALKDYVKINKEKQVLLTLIEQPLEIKKQINKKSKI